MGFHLSASLNVSSNPHLQVGLQDINCKDMFFHLRVFLSVLLNYYSKRMSFDNDCMKMAFSNMSP